MSLNLAIIKLFSEGKATPSSVKKEVSKKALFSFLIEGIKLPVPVIFDEIINLLCIITIIIIKLINVILNKN